MTDVPKTLERYRIPWKSDSLKQAAFAAPALRYAARHPAFLIGAAVVGVAGLLAWRNRERISHAAEPMIHDARVKGHALVEEAKAKGEALVEQAKATGQKVAAKTRTRRTAAPTSPLPDLH
ncbi:MAG: YtxH domain-containing protein [Phenylobacterium sp.]|nr:YtxH domain-containing protein [Phenylobacterium sp.]